MDDTSTDVRIERLLDLAIVHVATALDDHPEGATDEILAEFAIDQIGDLEEITAQEWWIARSAPFRTVVLRLVRAAQERADLVGPYRLCASPSPQFVRDWRAWGADALATVQLEAANGDTGR
jgi:hypothetical protein